jgi:glycosyltransferase involved in cell wall biosynthesis
MQRPLRVLLEASCLGDGRRDAGIGRYASQLIEALQGVPDLEIIPSVPASSPWSEARPARFLRAQPHVLSDAMARHPHLIHGLGGEPVLGFPMVRQVVTVHDVEMWRAGTAPGPAGAARRLYGTLLAPAIRACAGVIAVSETTRLEAIEALSLDPARVHVVPHGVAPVFSARPKLRDARIAEALGLDEPFVLWVGSLRSRDPRKGLDMLLEAMERRGEGGPILALAGALGPEADRLAAEAWRRHVPLVRCGPGHRPMRASASPRWRRWPAGRRWSPPPSGTCPGSHSMWRSSCRRAIRAPWPMRSNPSSPSRSALRGCATPVSTEPPGTHGSGPRQ